MTCIVCANIPRFFLLVKAFRQHRRLSSFVTFVVIMPVRGNIVVIMYISKLEKRENPEGERKERGGGGRAQKWAVQ